MCMKPRVNNTCFVSTRSISFPHIKLSTCTIFFFNDTASTNIYTLSLHDALPIWLQPPATSTYELVQIFFIMGKSRLDRKSTRLNSSHANISYAVFCLKKKRQRSTGRPTDTTTYQHTRPAQRRS